MTICHNINPETTMTFSDFLTSLAANHDVLAFLIACLSILVGALIGMARVP